MLRVVIAFLGLALLFLPTPPHAETSKKDLEIIARTFKFLTKQISGSITAAIIHDPSVAASKAEADALNSILSGGFSAEGATLTPKMVSVGNLSDLSGAKVAFVTPGLDAHLPSIFAAASKGGVLSIATYKECVTNGHCVLGVQSKPSVQIFVNKSAAQSSSIEFKQAFRVMITEF